MTKRRVDQLRQDLEDHGSDEELGTYIGGDNFTSLLSIEELHELLDVWEEAAEDAARPDRQ